MAALRDAPDGAGRPKWSSEGRDPCGLGGDNSGVIKFGCSRRLSVHQNSGVGPNRQPRAAAASFLATHDVAPDAVRVAPLMPRADQMSNLMSKRVVGRGTGMVHNRKGLLRICTD